MSNFTEIKIKVQLKPDSEVICKNSGVSTFQVKDSIKGLSEQAKPIK